MCGVAAEATKLVKFRELACCLGCFYDHQSPLWDIFASYLYVSNENDREMT